MYITKKHVSRRTVLKGMGVTVALPFLDAMLPAGTAWARTAPGSSKIRLVCMEMVHGSAGSTQFGLKEHLWSPALAGSNFDLSPTSLAPLEPFREYLTIVSNLTIAIAVGTAAGLALRLLRKDVEPAEWTPADRSKL